MDDMAAMSVPSWLESLLSTNFFKICPRHADVARNECNMFCLDCMKDSICFYCRSSRHKDHHVIQVCKQIRRSSYHNVVRVEEIQEVLDISGIQTYVINSARVLFINERPQLKNSGKIISNMCGECGRSLFTPFRFCSLGCKVGAILKKNRNEGLVSSNNKNGENVEKRKKSMPSKKEEDQQSALNNFEGSQEMYLSKAPLKSARRRSRKGIPHRAPF